MLCLSECKLTRGDKWYNGHMSQTEGGFECQAWTSHSPNNHESNSESNDPAHFPDATLEDAQNYCRNPDDSWKPWCYLADPDEERWDYCDIPYCGEALTSIITLPR